MVEFLLQRWSGHGRASALLVAGVVAINAVAMVAAVYFLAQSRASYEASAATSTQTISKILQQSIVSEVERIDLTLQVSVDELERALRRGQAVDNPDLRRFFDRQGARLVAGSTIRATDAAGRIVVGTGVSAPSGVSWASRAFFAGLRDGSRHGLWVTDPLVGAMSHIPVVAFVRRYDDPRGNFAGVVAVAVPVSHFAALLQQAAVGPKGIVLLRDSAQALITRVPPSSNPNEQLGARRFSRQLHDAIDSGLPTLTYFASNTGDAVARVETYRRLSAVPFSLVVGRAQSDVLAAWRRQLAWVLGFLGAFLGVTTLGAWRLGREMKWSNWAGQQAQTLLTNASDGLHVLDARGKLVLVSDQFCAMLGYRSDELIGKHVSFWNVGISHDELQALVTRQVEATTRVQFETRHRRKDGSEFPVEVSGKSLDILGERLLFNSSRDITERKKAEDDLRIAAVAFEAQQGLMVTDENAVIQRVNSECTRITGYAAAELIGRTPAIFQSGRHDVAFYAAMRAALSRDGHWQGEVISRHKSGSEYTEWLVISVVKDEAGRVIHYLASISDITREKEAASRIERMAYFDSLTDLPNRAQLRHRTERALEASRHSGQFGALLMLDLDRFKNVNDTMGHAVGDELLQIAARRMMSVMRHDSIAARFGGDEFSVLLPELGTDAAAVPRRAHQFAERLRAVLSERYQMGSQSFSCTASIGVAVYAPGGETVDSLMRNADLAMYQAKWGGRDGIRLFEPSMRAQLHARNTLESDLRNAIERKEFVFHYQLQVDRGRRPVGAEALVRWNHPHRGLLPPSEFVAVAEQCGLIGLLGQWALESACERIRAWSTAPWTRGLRIAVNVSPLQFEEPDFVRDVLDVVSASGIDPTRLKLEITESAILEHIDEAIESMRALRGHGIDFALDDFGTGSSSLAYVTRLPLYQLKIDRSFVENISSQRNAALVAQTIIAMGKGIGLEVLAEGVETREQLDFLLREGCDVFQGYFLGRPQPHDVFEREVAALPG